MKNKSGLLLSLAVLAAVIAGLVLPEYLMKLDKPPTFDLNGYQTVEISSTSSTDYAWRLRLISTFFMRGGTNGYTYSNVTDQYSQDQRDNIHQQFITQLEELENQGVLPPGTAEKASRSRWIDSYITFLFDPAEIRGTQCALVSISDPDESGLLMVSGIMDLESGKILGLSGYTSVWLGLMDRVSAKETTYQEILSNFTEYLGITEAAEGSTANEEPPRDFYREFERYVTESMHVALPGKRNDTMTLWIDVFTENFVIYLES